MIKFLHIAFFRLSFENRSGCRIIAMICEVDRFKLVMAMQNLQTRKISKQQFLVIMEQIVKELEQAVPWVVGEQHS
jgi:hypothetical protein